VYEVPGRPRAAIKVDQATQGLDTPGSPYTQELYQEAADLQQLKSRGYPVAGSELVRWSDAQGAKRVGLLMENVVGINSKELSGTFKALRPEERAALLQGIVPRRVVENMPPSWLVVTDRTLADLKRIQQLVGRNPVTIVDFQVMIDASDGSVRLIDVSEEAVDFGVASQEFLDALKNDIARIEAILKVKKAALGTP